MLDLNFTGPAWNVMLHAIQTSDNQLSTAAALFIMACAMRVFVSFSQPSPKSIVLVSMIALVSYTVYDFLLQTYNTECRGFVWDHTTRNCMLIASSLKAFRAFFGPFFAFSASLLNIKRQNTPGHVQTGGGGVGQ
tara:strand:- start:62 stop:466 length:405 start_codon:yes stop_codon:yes gene_type:complete